MSGCSRLVAHTRTSTVDFVVCLDAQLLLSLAHRVHTLFDVIARVTCSTHDANHPLHPQQSLLRAGIRVPAVSNTYLQTRPTIQANVAPAIRPAKVANRTGEEGMAGDGLY